MAIKPVKICPECGAELPSATIPAQCPNCLLGLGLSARSEKAEVRGQRPEGREKYPADKSDNSTEISNCFGDYELLEEIGRGGMGVVYKARQKSLDRIVALKLLIFGPHAPPEAVKRFRAEAVATAALQHPNIVAIHEVGMSAGQHFLVMDYVEGLSLAKAIGHQPLTAQRAARQVKSIAEAIHYAHERGILHRDLKPSNVLIDAQDQPRVTDFGLAKRLEGDSELTVSGQVLGSPNYMAPEQASGRRGALSRRSDVWALGAILYHALTGRPPFIAEGLGETVQQVLQEEPLSPRLLNPKVPVDLETVCLKCLEKEPPKRYGTACLVAEELGRYLEGQPVVARPVSQAAKVWRWCRRNPRLALATGAASLCLLIGLGGTTWQWREAESQRIHAEAERLLARRNAYAADMKEVRRVLDENDLGHARELLNPYRPSHSALDLAGWEWRYLWARCQGEERFTLWQYSNAVTALSFSVDGKWLAVRREDGAVAVWDAVRRRSLDELPGAGHYKALAFSPQGNLLAWGNKNIRGEPDVSLWDVSARKEIGRIPHSNDLASVAFSPDGQVLATGDSDGAVEVWEVAPQTVLTNFVSDRVNFWDELFPVASEVKAATTTVQTVMARVAEPMSFQRRRSQFDLLFRDHYGCVLFSPDGQWLAVGEYLPRIRLLNMITGQETVIPVPATGGITALAFSPDSQRLAAGCGFEDHHVYVWDVPRAILVARLAGHRGCIAGLAFSPDGQTLASVSVDQTLRLWDMVRKVERRRFQGHTDEVWAVAWSPDGLALVTGSKDGSVRYWDPGKDPAPTHAILNESAWLWGPAFFPDSQSLLTVTRPRGAVVRWCVEGEANTWRRVEELPWLGTSHSSVDLSRDGRWLALGDTNGNVRVWDYPNRQLVTNLVSPGRRIFALIFSPSGKILHCGTAVISDGRLGPKIYAVDGWRELELRGLKLNDADDWDLSPDERTAALSDQDGTVFWWDFVTGQQQTMFRYYHPGRVQVAFSRDGRIFATGTLGGQIRVWDVATRRIRLITPRTRNLLTELVSSPDGRRLMAAGISPNDLITVWDVETGREVTTLPGEPGLVVHSGFSPDGNILFATTFGGITQLWRAPSWEEIEAAESEKKYR